MKRNPFQTVLRSERCLNVRCFKSGIKEILIIRKINTGIRYERYTTQHYSHDLTVMYLTSQMISGMYLTSRMISGMYLTSRMISGMYLTSRMIYLVSDRVIKWFTGRVVRLFVCWVFGWVIFGEFQHVLKWFTGRVVRLFVCWVFGWFVFG